MASERIKVRVLFVDCDPTGAIHFTAVFRWSEEAELMLMRRFGLLTRTGGWPRRQLNVEYLVPIFFDDVIDFDLRVDRVGRTSIGLAWEASRDATVCVTGNHTIVQVGEDRKPVEIPAELAMQLTT